MQNSGVFSLFCTSSLTSTPIVKKLSASKPLKFEQENLSEAWKRWKEEPKLFYRHQKLIQNLEKSKI